MEIFLIGMIEDIREEDGAVGTRVVGYFGDLLTAQECLEQNCCDLHEGIYNYAVVENVKPGLYRSTEATPVFFQWDKEKGGYVKIEKPKALNNFCSFTIG